MALFSLLLAAVVLLSASGQVRADDGSQTIVIIDDGATVQDVPVPPDVTDPDVGNPGSVQQTDSTPTPDSTGDTTQPGPATSTHTSTATVPETKTVTTPPSPPRGLYCHVVNGAWKQEDLVRDQEVNDPVWAAQGPWKDAYYDPTTGIGSCDFPASPANTTAATTTALSNTSTNQSEPKPAQQQPKGAVRLPPLSVTTTASGPTQSKSITVPTTKQSTRKASTKLVALPTLSTTPTG